MMEYRKSSLAIPKIRQQAEQPLKGHKAHHWFMMACCAFMVVGFGLVHYSGTAGGSLSATLSAAAPLLLCLGAHLLMHRFMGRSCHLDNSEKDK